MLTFFHPFVLTVKENTTVFAKKYTTSKKLFWRKKSIILLFSHLIFLPGLPFLEEAKAIQSVVLSNRVNYWTGKETKVFERSLHSGLSQNLLLL